MIARPHDDDDAERAAPATPQMFNFNPDPAWQDFVRTFEPMIVQIATKYCATDEALREDTAQEARIALATIYPENVRSFAAYRRGEISGDDWQAALLRFCHQVIRNAVLDYLNRWPTGNWYIGRTRHVKDKQTGKSRKVYLPSRFSSLNELVDDHGMQVSTTFEISWPETVKSEAYETTRPPRPVRPRRRDTRATAPGEVARG